MSKESIQGIHDAIQAHLDETKDTGEKLADFVVVRAATTDEGGYMLGYISSGDITPHGAVGLLDFGKDLLREDLMGPADPPV